MTSSPSTTPTEKTVTAEFKFYLAVEPRIIELEAWAALLMHLGSFRTDVPFDSIAVIGQAVSRAVAWLKVDAGGPETGAAYDH